MADVFERVEQRCLRFFPPGDGKDQVLDGALLRHYPSSDVRVYIEGESIVYYRYFRALNSTVIGTVAQVRSGDFRLDCDKLAGRYQPPWQRE
jgi:hypothetical protein